MLQKNLISIVISGVGLYLFSFESRFIKLPQRNTMHTKNNQPFSIGSLGYMLSSKENLTKMKLFAFPCDFIAVGLECMEVFM